MKRQYCCNKMIILIVGILFFNSAASMAQDAPVKKYVNGNYTEDRKILEAAFHFFINGNLPVTITQTDACIRQKQKQLHITTALSRPIIKQEQEVPLQESANKMLLAVHF